MKVKVKLNSETNATTEKNCLGTRKYSLDGLPCLFATNYLYTLHGRNACKKEL